MRRRPILFVLASLVLGALATWAVAWTAAVYLPHSRSERLPAIDCSNGAEGRIDSVMGVQLIGVGFEQTEHMRLRGWSGSCLMSIDLEAFECRYGWPLYALEYDHQGGYWRESCEWLPQTQGWPTCRQGPSQALPLRVAPVGFAFNTLAFSAVVCVPAGTFMAIRRRWRLRHGRCRTCGYSLAGLTQGAACPECGAGKEAAA